MQDSLPKQQGPVLLIDANLADRALAQALSLVGYTPVAVTEQFDQGVPDPTLIQWLGLQGGIWVTADEKAKGEHAEEIKSAGIHIVWVRRPKTQEFSKKAQLLLLLWVIDDILQEIARAKGPAQFRAYFRAYYRGKKPKYDRL